MDSEVWIHIGPPKTGTSAIQNWLLNNRQFLADNGVFYPLHNIGANSISSGHKDIVLIEKGSEFIPNEKKIENLKQEFQASGCSRMLLTSEYFFSCVDSLCEYFPKARFIAYIRCPIESYESSYNQSVKRHWRTSPLTFSENLHTTTLDKLATFAQSLTRNRFYFRAYLSSAQHHFNLIEDFLSQLDIKRNVPMQQTNLSYTYESLEVKRWLNRFNFTELDSQIDEALQQNREGLSSYSLLPPEKEKKHTSQSINTLRLFHTLHHIKNVKLLLASYDERQQFQHVSQKLTPQHLDFVASRLAQKNKALYQDICTRLQSHALAQEEKFNIGHFGRYLKTNNLLSRLTSLVTRK